MNIEIANRLVNLRKSNNLSQEALAEKLGISRQAVSKWERAEASPDTDNLILLARIYGVSLDELLQTEDEIPRPEAEEEVSETNGDGRSEEEDQKSETDREGETAEDASGTWYEETSGKKEYVHIGFDGIHVKDEDSEVHVGWKGIHVVDKDKASEDGSPQEVHIDKHGVYVDGEKYDGVFNTYFKPEFPFIAVAFLAYVICGIIFGTWGIGLLLFPAIWVVESIFTAIRKRKAKEFNYFFVTFIVFMLLGYYKGLWHPGWVVFLTIPVYYSLVSYFSDLWKGHKAKK